MFGNIAAIWGFAGVCLFLGSAIVRLGQIGLQINIVDLEVKHWLVMVIWISFMAYYEGYKGFQKGFSPRVAARLRYLKDNANYKRLMLAPLFCLGYFDAERRRIIFVCCLTLVIFLIIQLVEYIPMPWRAILDLGVVVGLGWGLTSMIIFTIQAFIKPDFDFPAGVPDKR